MTTPDNARANPSQAGALFILPAGLVGSGLKPVKILLISLLSIALLPGCATHPGLFAEVSGNIQHRTGASDWTLQRCHCFNP
jgi:hypothetical protein